MSRQYGPNRTPNINASLIREGRMIFQQLSQIFGDRQPRRTEPVKGASLPLPARLKCAFCIDITKRQWDADTIIDGYAVCPKHAQYVRGDRYTEILRDIRKAEDSH